MGLWLRRPVECCGGPLRLVIGADLDVDCCGSGVDLVGGGSLGSGLGLAGGPVFGGGLKTNTKLLLQVIGVTSNGSIL